MRKVECDLCDKWVVSESLLEHFVSTGCARAGTRLIQVGYISAFEYNNILETLNENSETDKTSQR